MAGKSKSPRRWPTADILRRAEFAKEAGPICFVDTEAAARYLALEAHTLECYRSLGEGPAYHKFGKYVRYAVEDLDSWAAKSLFRNSRCPSESSDEQQDRGGVDERAG
jgi:hypothetical protein